MESRARQTMINCIKMLSHTDEAFKLMKEILIEYINEDKRCIKEIKQDMINSINMLPQNTGSFKLLIEMLIRRINEDKAYTTLTGIEKNFQEDMINEMDSQY